MSKQMSKRSLALIFSGVELVIIIIAVPIPEHSLNPHVAACGKRG